MSPSSIAGNELVRYGACRRDELFIKENDLRLGSGAEFNFGSIYLKK